MYKAFSSKVCYTTLAVVFMGLAPSISIPSVTQNKQLANGRRWNLTTANELRHLNEINGENDSKYHLFEPQLFTRLFRKLLTRSQDWKEHMKKIANIFVSSYFITENITTQPSIYKTGKRVSTHVTNLGPESTKISKKNHKRNINKQRGHELEAKKPFNFAPIVQFIPASLDLSNKIMLYQPQLIINGSVYIEQEKDLQPMQILESQNIRNRDNIFYV